MDTADLAQVDAELDVIRLMNAYRLMQMHHARALHHEGAARGLNATDIRFVVFLSAAEGRGVTPKQAGEYLELSTGAMTSLIDRLADRYHIERRPNPDDRRSILLHLTPSGEAVAGEIADAYRVVFTEHVDPELRGPIADTFERIGKALHRRAQATSA